MAARLHARHQDEIRAKIQTSQLLNRLSDHAHGIVELSQTQIKAIEILLKKSMPDLSAVEHTGEVVHSYAARLPAPQPDAEKWQQQHSPAALPPTMQ